MADHDRAIDAETVEHVAQHGRLIGRRTALTRLARTEAEAGPVDQDHPMTHGKALA